MFMILAHYTSISYIIYNMMIFNKQFHNNENYKEASIIDIRTGLFINFYCIYSRKHTIIQNKKEEYKKQRKYKYYISIIIYSIYNITTDKRFDCSGHSAAWTWYIKKSFCRTQDKRLSDKKIINKPYYSRQIE